MAQKQIDGSRSVHRLSTFARELQVFVRAVLVGTTAGIVCREGALRWVGDATAANIALAVATTVTGATHARLVHRQSVRDLVPQVLCGAPAAYGTMRVIHALLGA
jgi:hypothetical protein